MHAQKAKSDVEVSSLIFGTWRLCERGVSQSDLAALIDVCLEAGVSSFDLADIYGNYQVEAFFGSALTPALRERMQLITKCGICLPSEHRPHHRVKHYNTSAQHVRNSVEQSLRNLRTDRLDVLLIHRPDPLLQFSELAQLFEALKAEGKVQAFGVSNFTAAQFQSFQSCLSLPLLTNQIELSPLHPQALWDGTLDHAQAHGYRPMIWSPLAGGKVFHGTDTESLRLRKCLQEIAVRYECELDQLLLAWLLYLPSRVIPVLGTTQMGRLQSQLKALSLNLERQDWYQILEAGQGFAVP